MSLQDLKRQIQSVNNTAKMTQALQTISAIKLNKARNYLDRTRPYTDNVEEMMREIADKARGETPLLVGRDEVNNIAICTVTSDRGLAGAFNAQVLRRTMELRNEQDSNVGITQIVTGRKGQEFFRFRKASVEEAYTGFSDSPTYAKAQEIGRRLTDLFIARVQPAIADVVQHVRMEERRVLGHDADRTAHALDLQVVKGLLVDVDLARARHVEAVEQPHDRRLATARGPDEGDLLAGGDCEAQVAEDRPVWMVCELHVLEADGAASEFHRLCVWLVLWRWSATWSRVV